MPLKKTKLSVDGHLHLYPQYRLQLALDTLVANLDRNVLAGSSDDQQADAEQEIFKLAFLFTGKSVDFFGLLQKGLVDLTNVHYKIVPGPEPHSLFVLRNGVVCLCLVAGQQVVTAERIEVLGLAIPERIADGLPARQVIAEIIEAGGIPVLPWSPGKWFFKRGRIIEDILLNSAFTPLVLGDTSLRPAQCPLPRLMRLGRRRKMIVIAGSDPLPFPGEEKLTGSYGFIYQGEFDSDRPVTSIKAILSGDPSRIRIAGRRCGSWQVLRRLQKNRAVH